MEYETLIMCLKRPNYASYDFTELSQTVTEFVFMLRSEQASVGNPATCPQVIHPSVQSTLAPCRGHVGLLERSK
jgi:hypothetical protein